MSAALQQPLTPRHILVVTLADLGDALLTTPALLSLRHTLPEARITVLTTRAGAAALHGLPAYDELILFEKHQFDSPWSLLRPANLRAAWQLWRRLRLRQSDACVIFHHLTTWFGTLKYAALAFASGAPRRYGRDNGRGFFLTDRIRDDGFGARHQASYWLDLVGLLDGNATPLPTFIVHPADMAYAAILVPPRDDVGGPSIALHPGSGAFAPARRWLPSRFAALADALIAEGARIVLVGGPEEAALRASVVDAMQRQEGVLDLGGKTSLGELAAVLQRCDLFVGNDSGVAHLASSVGTPVIALFGPTDPRAWGPFGGEEWQVTGEFADGVAVLRSGPHRALKSEIACSPCIYRGHSLGSPNGCPDRTCLRRIDVAQPLALIRERLQEMNG